MKWIVLLLAAGAMASGCGDSSDAPRPSVVQTKSEQAMAGPQGKTSTSEELGIALYPDARVLSKNVRDKTVQADIEISDPVDRAVKFYEAELAAKSDGKAPMTTIEGNKGGYHFVVVLAPKSGGKTAISILGEKG